MGVCYTNKINRKKLICGTLSKEDFRTVYSMLDVPPLDSDCGSLCQSLCCKEFEPGVGMYLLPGEEQMFSGNETWLTWTFPKARHNGFPSSWKGRVAFIMCRGECPRDSRPIQCRTFPLMPYLSLDGKLETRVDILSGILICPLVKYRETYHLNPKFLKAVQSGWEVLIKDPLIWDLVWQRSRELDEELSSPWLKLIESLEN
ncbi:MAG TPA: hypothetical protein PLB36_00230 [Bacillota bacterium]|nr:hypothetical protein [Bacillota bacterium]HOL11293.1 hypothetical protein [Bacillota bacterium]HOQ02422.1 hypothetical protein [Bacillota bacterium]HPP60221.1 hypothetical protein [Bacillota bacterium]HPV12940.1 hypothetical protein [Bacillota bacterium]